MLKEARRIIEEGLAESQTAICAWSGGIDSMLLLYLLRKYNDIPVLWYFTDDLTSKQKQFAHRIIREWDLTVFSYAPNDVYYLPNEEGVTLVREYSIGDAQFPVLTDVEHSDKCGLDVDKQRTPSFFYHWDVTFCGLKHTDTHYITGRPHVPNGTQVGNTKLYSPLYHMTDLDVRTLTRKLKIPVNEKKYAGDKHYDPDYQFLCTNCFSQGGEHAFCPKLNTMIPTHPWEKELSLESFRQRFLAVV